MKVYLQFDTREGFAYEPIDIEKEDVDTLRPLMPEAFNHDLALEVAFKEGYNKLVSLLEEKANP